MGHLLLHHDLFAVHDVQALRGLNHAAALQVEVTVIGYCFTVHVADASRLVEADEVARAIRQCRQVSRVSTNGESVQRLVEANALFLVHQYEDAWF